MSQHMSLETDKPLAGLRVLDIATFIAAPFCGATLAEFGAEVIKSSNLESATLCATGEHPRSVVIRSCG